MRAIADIHTSSKHLECVLLLLRVTVGRAGADCLGLDLVQKAAGVGCRSNDACDERFCWMADNKLLGESFDKAGDKASIRLASGPGHWGTRGQGTQVQGQGTSR